MKLAGEVILAAYAKRHAGAAKPLKAWETRVRLANWRSPAELKVDFPAASLLANNRVIFNIGGNSHRLVAEAIYAHGTLIISWIGTHAEYDKRNFNA